MKSHTRIDIGTRMRQLRRKANLSLQQLARLSGVSKAMLSQIEQNKTNPTVAVVLKIARALRVELSELVQAGPRRRFNVIRSEDEKYLFSSDEKCTVRTLSPLSLEKDIEFYRIDLQPKASLSSEPHFHDTEEFLTVAKGRVRLQSAESEVVLRAGDSVHYSADVNHSITNISRRSSTVYLVVKYRNE